MAAASAPANLGRYAAFSGVLAMAGLPMYIHAPRYYSAEMGVDLAAFGGALLLLRLFDSLQDPVIGLLADRWRRSRQMWMAVATVLLASGFVVLFAPPGGPPLARLFIGMALACTGFSAASIALYDHGTALTRSGASDHTRTALWRETGALTGVCIAALAPSVFAAATSEQAAFGLYAAAFCVAAAFAAWGMGGRWLATARSETPGLIAAFRRPGVAPLLGFALLNSLPVAMTSTLFLFYVEDALQTPAHAGPLLLAFFLAAAVATPIWTALARRIGRKSALLWGMCLSIVSFIGAATLQPGDVGLFYVICVASGAAMSADITFPPVMLAAKTRESGGAAFGLWAWAQKMSFALAAGVALPVLAMFGYDPGAEVQSADARAGLVLLYAIVPCVLKVIAITALWASSIGEQPDEHAIVR